MYEKNSVCFFVGCFHGAMADSCPAVFVVVDIPDIIIADVCPAGMI